MKRLLIVGGGFAGMGAALAAKSFGGDRILVRLLSRDPFLTIRPRLYEATPETLTADLAGALAEAGVEFRQANVAAIDAQRVTLDDGTTEDFDRLVVATGSVMARPPIAGADTAFSVDNLAEAIAFDAKLRAIASHPRPTIAVVGAGFTGIELALELRDRLAAHGAADDGDRAKIVLLDRADAVGPDLGDAPRPLIVEALAAANTLCRLGVDIAAIGPDRVQFANGDSLHADAVVLCTGLVAAPLAALVPGARDALGRVVVDADLRAPAAPTIFVAGDAAAAQCAPGHVTLMSCQHARASGAAAGANAARDLLGEPLACYRQDHYVTCLDLGRSGAMFSEGWARIPRMTGAEGKAMKHLINRSLIYPPGHPAPDFTPAAPVAADGA